MKHLWVWLTLGGVAALYFLRNSPVLAGLDPFAPPAPPLPNYPPGTPDSVSTGIAGMMATAYKPFLSGTFSAPGDAAPAQFSAPTPSQIPAASQGAPAMGGAAWGTSAIFDAALTPAIALSNAQPLVTVTGPSSETQTGRGHF